MLAFSIQKPIGTHPHSAGPEAAFALMHPPICHPLQGRPGEGAEKAKLPHVDKKSNSFGSPRFCTAPGLFPDRSSGCTVAHGKLDSELKARTAFKRFDAEWAQLFDNSACMPVALTNYAVYAYEFDYASD